MPLAVMDRLRSHSTRLIEEALHARSSQSSQIMVPEQLEEPEEEPGRGANESAATARQNRQRRARRNRRWREYRPVDPNMRWHEYVPARQNREGPHVLQEWMAEVGGNLESVR